MEKTQRIAQNTHNCFHSIRKYSALLATGGICIEEFATSNARFFIVKN